MQRSFDKVKELIVNCTVLRLFDPDLPVIVSRDASAYGIGAVLLQVKDNYEFPIVFASRTLTNAERKYSVGEKEALSCVWACEKWFQCLWATTSLFELIVSLN